ncbi:MAG: OmpA family protein [Candidatus Azobacteroides sp.]|nr:OmpA family protein [Candidatus Azobacteroides sp.]
MRKLFLFVLVAAPFLCMNAQTSETSSGKPTFLNTGGNWFLTVSGGISHLFSEGSGRLDLFDNVQPTVGLSLGKWMTPVWGLRLSATGAKLKGYTNWNETAGKESLWYKGINYPSPYSASDTYIPAGYYPNYVKETFLGKQKNDKDGNNGYLYDVPYISGGLDLLLNLSNAFCGYSPNRVFNFVVFGGIGYAHTFKDGDKGDGRTAVNNIMEKGGFIADFRLSDAINLGLEANALILPENFDRQVGGSNNHDVVANVMLGITYKFKPRNFVKADLKDQREIDALNNEINRLRDQNNELSKRPVSCPACPECAACPEPTVIKETKKVFDYLPKPVFFRINSSVIDDAQWSSIEEAVRYLRTTPDAKLKVTGYADKKTGTPAGNKKLSEKRAQAVYNAMVKKYNIDPSRIQTDFLGDEVQPFGENDWNRVVVFVKD